MKNVLINILHDVASSITEHAKNKISIIREYCPELMSKILATEAVEYIENKSVSSEQK